MLVALAAVLPVVLTDLAGGTPDAAAQNATCGYSQDQRDYIYRGADDRVNARASVSPRIGVVADTAGNLGQDVAKVTVSNGRSSMVPAGAVDYCTSVRLTHIAGPAARQRSFQVYSSSPPSEFSARPFSLSAGTWQIEYTVTVGLAETFDGKINVYEDTYTETLKVATPPCGESLAGPQLPSLDSPVRADMAITGQPGSVVSNDRFIANTPTNSPNEWVFAATLGPGSSPFGPNEAPNGCYTYEAAPLSGTAGTAQRVDTTSRSAVHFDLEPGRWKLTLNMRTTTFDGEVRHLTASDTDTRIVTVAMPVGVDPAPEPLPTDLRVRAEAAGYHPSWGIAQTTWSTSHQLPANQHWLRFRLQGSSSAGQHELADAQLKALIVTPTNSRRYLPSAEFVDGDAAGYDFIETKGVWNEMTEPGRYEIHFWVHQNGQSFWSNPVTLTIR